MIRNLKVRNLPLHTVNDILNMQAKDVHKM